MAKTGWEVPRCAYPGCENERRPGEAEAEPGYCGLPDPVTGEPHTALTAFRQRQVLARQGGGIAGPENAGPRGRPRRHAPLRPGAPRSRGSPVLAPARRPGRPPPGRPRAARAAADALRKAENTCRPPQEHPGPQADGQASSLPTFLLTSSLPSMISSGQPSRPAGAS
jgi:hypothetical protein